LNEELPPMALLPVLIATGVITYFILGWVVMREALMDILGVVFPVIARKTA
jgi:hypothetical protein